MVQLIAEVITETVVNDLEPVLLRRMIQTHKPGATPEALDEIVDATRRRLALAEGMRACKKARITQQVLSHLAEENVIHIDGFTRFRLQDYTTDLEKILARECERYELEQKHRELVHGLRHFMEIQPSEVEKLHILPDDYAAFRLVDDGGALIHDDDFESFIWSLGDSSPVDREEFLLSALVRLAPDSIVNHMAQPTWKFGMLRDVFHDRMTYCPGCALCQA